MSYATVKHFKYGSSVKTRGAALTRINKNIAATLLVPAAGLLTTEWIHRGTLLGGSFFSAFIGHFFSYALAWTFLVLVYASVSQITGYHNLATAAVGIIGSLPAAVTYYKLQLRGEPFFPWDISQMMEASNVMGKANLELQPSMLWTIIIFAALIAWTSFIRNPLKKMNPRLRLRRMAGGIFSVVLLAGLVFGVYLQPAVTSFFKIIPDMWMQNRYYANYGVISGFLSNLQTLHISKPDSYSQETIEQLKETAEKNKPGTPLYPGSYAAATDKPVETPNVIYIMSEAFWDVTELDGITYEEDITPTLHSLKDTAAVGRSYSPSFGGGTCDVEFEALTGYSMEHLPAGCKPYQQHVTKGMFSLPNYLKSVGYNTLAIHGYYRKYWNRDKAYPHLGIDRFIAAEDFTNPERKRGYYWKGGLISDSEISKRIIEEYENRDKEKPLFIHAVTMQNHSSYNQKNYPEDELVTIQEAPETISASTLSQLRDFATGIKEADAMLGTLVDYFSKVDEPTVLVFWGDHYNTVGKGYELYEKTGYISKGDTKSPNLHGTPLVIWSNYCDNAVDIGTVAAYNISPVMMDLYGLQKPLLFDFLTQEMSLFRARTRGVTVNPDGNTSEEMTPEQEQWFNDHWLLQYDCMFGEHFLEDYIA